MKRYKRKFEENILKEGSMAEFSIHADRTGGQKMTITLTHGHANIISAVVPLRSKLYENIYDICFEMIREGK
jgi:hypothetical protein